MRDDKVVAAWNGLAIAALAEAGALCDEPAWTTAAAEAAEWLVAAHWNAGSRVLVRTSLEGRVNRQAPGVLEDYADLAEGLLALYQVTGDVQWFTTAGALVEAILDRFGDGRGGFFDTSVDARALVRRPRDPSDGVTPSGASGAAHALLTYAALTGERRYQEAADAAIAALMPVADTVPRFAGWTLATVAARLAGPIQVAVVLPEEASGVGPSGRAAGQGLHRVALAATSPGLVVAVGAARDPTVPLLAGRPEPDGLPTAYPCRGFVCDLPVTTAAELERALARHG